MSYTGYGSYSSYSSYSSTSSYRSGRSSLSSYNSSSYEPYSWRKTSAYTPKTYDFGSLTGSYGSGDSHYSSKYNEYSWTAKDLLTDNPENKEVDVQLKESIKEKVEVSTEKLENADTKDGLDKDKSIDSLISKDVKKKYDYTSYLKESYTKDFSKETAKEDKDAGKKQDHSSYLTKSYTKDFSNDTTKKDNSRDNSNDIFKKYYTNDYSRDNEGSTRKDSSEEFKGLYNKDYYTKYYGSKLSREDEDKKKSLLKDVIGEKDEKKDKFETTSLDINQNYVKDKKNVPHVTEKKVFNFEDDDVFVKPKEETPVKSGIHDLFKAIDEKPTNKSKKTEKNTTTIKQKPIEPVKKVEKKEKLKKVTNTGPLRMHQQGIVKFISAIPDQRRYVSSVNFLPDRIELRFVGVPEQKKMKRCRSITDLYEITVEPDQDKNNNDKIHPWEETVKCRKQDMSYSYDSENEILYYSKPRHEHTKEMYISQYTHHFDKGEPRTHIAGWKCDVEPNGIPHNKSRMCVVRSPVVSESSKRLPRPKSAPPQLVASPEPVEEPVRSVKVDVAERGYYTIPRRVARQEDYDSVTEEVSSIGYAPSDDTSDSSAFYSQSHNDRKLKDPDFGYNKPRLIRLSAEFPGLRNLEKMKRKRQSMGSYSSAGSLSSVGQSPSPRKGDYGFFVALTSDHNDPRKVQPKRQHRHSHYQ